MTTNTGSAGKRVLIIEDDPDISDVLTYNLNRDGYQTLKAMDGVDGLKKAREEKPDLIILDLMLPQKDGIEVCRELRYNPATRNTPILILTAKSSEGDQLVGFSIGADDYVTKPFSVKVLMQRVRVLINRRMQVAQDESESITRHGITLDRSAHEVRVEGAEVALTPTEYKILEALIRSPGRAFTRYDLLASAVGDDTIVLERTIDVHIRSLRIKLDKHADAIETVRGVGYRFAREN